MYTARNNEKGWCDFPCGRCKEYVDAKYLRCWNTIIHNGAVCVKCIKELHLSKEKEEIMMHDEWDWNFCGQKITTKNPVFVDSLL